MIQRVSEHRAVIIGRMYPVERRIQPSVCLRVQRAVGLRCRGDRMDDALRLTRFELLEIESEWYEQLLPIAQPVDQHLGREDFHEGSLVLRRSAAGVRFARELRWRFYDVGLLAASATSIWFRSCEKSTGFA